VGEKMRKREIEGNGKRQKNIKRETGRERSNARSKREKETIRMPNLIAVEVNKGISINACAPIPVVETATMYLKHYVKTCPNVFGPQNLAVGGFMNQDLYECTYTFAYIYIYIYI